MYEDAIHGAGLITGLGRIEGRECVVVCNDSTIKGGTYYPMTVKKHLCAQEIALENRLPCIYLVDSGGANLSYQSKCFLIAIILAAFSTIGTVSSVGIPQIAPTKGSCTAGGAKCRPCPTKRSSLEIRERSFSPVRPWSRRRPAGGKRRRFGRRGCARSQVGRCGPSRARRSPCPKPSHVASSQISTQERMST